MIEVELLEAKAQKKRVYIALASGFVAIALLIGLLLQTIPSSPSLSPESEGTQKALPSEAASSSLAQATSSESQSTEDQSEFKDQFFKAVKSYEDNTQPKLSEYKTLMENRELMASIDGYQQKAASQAAQGLYRDGIATLKLMEDEASSRIDEETSRLARLLKEVTTSWAKKDIELASASLESARLISPENEDVVRYSKLLNDWPEVEAFLQQADEKESQGNVDEAIQSLQSISKLNHDLDNLSSRIDVLQAKRKEITESRLAEQLFVALEKSDLSSASNAIRQLKNAGIPESNYAHLLSDYKKQKYDSDLVMISNALDSAIVKDDWVKAKQLVDQNQKVFGAEPRFKARADAIYKIHKNIDDVSNVLAKSNQLLSSRVRANAHNLLERIAPDLNMSSQLQTLASRLSEQLTKYRTKVPVTVVSDGLTFIEVKSVGKVGETTGRVVELLPGKYIFIGKKPGYVSKQVELNVEPETPTQIKVIADEPI
jgi:hypothetical protein